jgi:hypothetical protein
MEDYKQNSQTSQNSSLQTKFNNLNPSSKDSHTQDMETNSRAPLKKIDQNGTIDRGIDGLLDQRKEIKDKIEQCKRKRRKNIYNLNAFVL